MARPARYPAIAIGFLLTLLLAALCGFGWLYFLRGIGWFAIGPKVGDALPLLQLAGFDLQPLARVIIAWLAAGVIAGLLTWRLEPGRRAIAFALLGAVILFVASQATYALARNLHFTDVLFGHLPGSGGFVEAAVLAAGSYLPGGVIGRRQGPGPRPGRTVGRLGDRGLGRGEHRDTGQHDRDSHQVAHHHERLGAQ